jgi:hypothetical protein
MRWESGAVEVDGLPISVAPPVFSMVEKSLGRIERAT